MATKTTKRVMTQSITAAKFAQKSLRAYVGLYGAAYERIQPALKTARKNFDGYAVKGEKLETAATTYAKDARVRANKRLDTATNKVRSVLPSFANDRVQEMEAEIAKLNKKIVSLSKKAPKRVVKTAKKVAEVTQAA